MSKSTSDILFKGRKILDDSIKKEIRNQGHFLTGNLERSLTATLTEGNNETILEGEIAFYAGILNAGVSPERASMKQFPFLVKFWQLRGLDPKTAKRAAAATIRKWMKEGMPTNASKRFSKTGQRKGALSIALARVSKRVDEVIVTDLSREIDKEFMKTKSETI